MQSTSLLGSGAVKASGQPTGHDDDFNALTELKQDIGPSTPNNLCEELKTDIESNVQNPKVANPFTSWCRMYFWEGQALTKTQFSALQTLEPGAPWHKRLLVRHRRILGLLIPAAFFHFWWWLYMIKYNTWSLFQDRFIISITMIFGSMIAGMTSVGGGAVAFPVMTLALQIKPTTARDFSLMIQSCGMSAAAFTIFFMRVELESVSLMLCSLGGVFGIIFGIEVVDPRLTPAHKKMGFVCVWFSFAFALFLLNRYRDRRTFKRVQKLCFWKQIVLFVTGFVGGIFSSIAGSGIDICSFSILTLFFRVSEKVATPTSVVLMAANSLIGFYWRAVMDATVSQDAWDYLAVCIPIVVLGAPFGSVVGSHFHRLVLAGLIYVLDTVALITAFAIVPQTPALIGMSVGIIIGGFVFFYVLTRTGQKIMPLEETEELDSGESPDMKTINDQKSLISSAAISCQ